MMVCVKHHYMEWMVFNITRFSLYLDFYISIFLYSASVILQHHFPAQIIDSRR